MVISAVAEQAPDRIERLVYVDTFLPDDGQCALDLLPPEIGAYFRQIANEHGNGWRLPGGDGQLDLWGLKPGPARDFVRECLCDFSIHCFEGRVALPHDLKSRLPALYISCTAPDYPARPFFAPFAAKARNLGWPVVEIESGHDCHVEKPDQFAAAL
jgi:pimeloyl-ACP methyl ester carboxylesterase